MLTLLVFDRSFRKRNGWAANIAEAPHSHPGSKFGVSLKFARRSSSSGYPLGLGLLFALAPLDRRPKSVSALAPARVRPFLREFTARPTLPDPILALVLPSLQATERPGK